MRSDKSLHAIISAMNSDVIFVEPEAELSDVVELLEHKVGAPGAKGQCRRRLASARDRLEEE